MQSLDKMAGGALLMVFNRAWNQVISNMKDPNTSFKESRKITIELTFRQPEERNKMLTAIKVTPKLSTVRPLETQFAIGRDLSSGEVLSKEIAVSPADDIRPEEKDTEVQEDSGGKESENRITRFRKEA